MNDTTSIFTDTIEYIIVTPRDIVSAFAYCIIRQSPYVKIDNLPEILEDIRLYITGLGFEDESKYIDKYSPNIYIGKTCEELWGVLNNIKNNIKSFRKLNITKVELDNGIEEADDEKRKIKHVFVGRGIVNPRDKDFIDLDACIQNVFNMLIK